MRDTFCILPWNHLEVKPTGTVKICCVAAREVAMAGQPVTVGRNSFAEIWNSQYMQDVRRAMLDGRPIPDCAYCYRQESSGAQAPSFRELNNREWMARYSTSEEGLMELARQQGVTVQSPPAYLQLSLGNECNLKCRMCCSDYSNQIERDPVHSKWVPPSPTIPRSYATSWYKDDAFFSDLFAEPKLLRKLYVTGGEPMMSHRLQKILDLLVEEGQPENVHIVLNTNATVANPRILERLVRFKSVWLGCSIDAYGADYEYIRFPAKWSTVLRTLDTFREYAGLFIGFNPTLQAYNAMNITELYRFCDERDIFCAPQIMYGPEHLTMLVMPRAARNEAASRLRCFIASPSTTATQTRNRELAKRVLEYLEDAPEPRDLDRLARELARFTNDLDRSRGQSFKRTHRELYDYFTSSGLGWSEEGRYFETAPDRREIVLRRLLTAWRAAR